MAYSSLQCVMIFDENDSWYYKNQLAVFDYTEIGRKSGGSGLGPNVFILWALCLSFRPMSRNSSMACYHI